MTTALVNGRIHGNPRASAVLIKEGSIAGLGSDDLATLATEVIDLEGRPLLPGFQDSHAHPSQAGLELAACHLLDTAHSEQAYLAAIAEYAARSGAPWIIAKKDLESETIKKAAHSKLPKRPLSENFLATSSIWSVVSTVHSGVTIRSRICVLSYIS